MPRMATEIEHPLCCGGFALPEVRSPFDQDGTGNRERGPYSINMGNDANVADILYPWLMLGADMKLSEALHTADDKALIPCRESQNWPAIMAAGQANRLEHGRPDLYSGAGKASRVPLEAH
jgi:hypothetical protein